MLQTFPHIFLIRTFGWKNRYLALLYFNQLKSNNFQSIIQLFNWCHGRSFYSIVGYVTAKNIVGCN